MGIWSSKGSRRSASPYGYNSGPAPSSWGSRYSQPAPYSAPSYGSSSECHDCGVSARSYSYGAPSQHYAAPPPPERKPDHKLQRRYSRIADNYSTLEQVTEALAQAGLESSNLIVGIDFTKSNEWTGARSFHRCSLHHIGDSQNPYEQAISIFGRTLSAFDEDNLIPCFGFGDASTHDQDVFSFYPDERPCNGFEEALMRYREIVPHLRLAGPTSFAPIIEMAVTIVEQSGGQYHVLLIIADGQVTRSVDTERGHLSPQEQNTVDAIVRASEHPLSIILVGVGDGPWDMMREFDDNIPARAFDNFQFVNFTEIMLKNMPLSRKETEFALSALMEIPSQYKATIDLQILGSRGRWKSLDRVPLPPPLGSYDVRSFTSKPARPTSFVPSFAPSQGRTPSVGTAPPTATSAWDNQLLRPTFRSSCWSSLMTIQYQRLCWNFSRSGCCLPSCTTCAENLIYRLLLLLHAVACCSGSLLEACNHCGDCPASRFAQFASPILKTWHSVVGIRHVVTVGSALHHAPYAGARLIRESSSIKNLNLVLLVL